MHQEVELQTTCDESQNALIKIYLYEEKIIIILTPKIEREGEREKTVLLDAGGDINTLV